MGEYHSNSAMPAAKAHRHSGAEPRNVLYELCTNRIFVDYGADEYIYVCSIGGNVARAIYAHCKNRANQGN